jgi:uncharacterized protein (UPF0212 family)
MEYTVRVTIEDNVFQIEANSQEDAEKIAESRCEQYLKDIDYVDVSVSVSPNPPASNAHILLEPDHPDH